MADADLTQFNRVAADAEAANAADALTSQLLLITDGKKIVGETNSAGKAPVNRGTKALALMIAGLRGALFGNVTGIAKRSLKSLLVDGTGGVSHTLAAGLMSCLSALVNATASGTSLPNTAQAQGTITKDSVCLGWVRAYWDGANMVIVRAWNCRSVVRNSTGDYTIVFQPAVASPTTVEVLVTLGVNPSVVAHGFVGNAVSTTDDGSSRPQVNIVTIDPNAGALLDTSAVSPFYLEIKGY